MRLFVDSLAAYYQKQGLHVSGAKRGEGLQVAKKYVSDVKPIAGMPFRNEVLDAVINALDGAVTKRLSLEVSL